MEGNPNNPHEPLEEGLSAWREEFDASALRDEDFETMSGIALGPVYGPGDWPGRGPADVAEADEGATSRAGFADSPSPAAGRGDRESNGEEAVFESVAERLGWPGRPPYTRGPYASMYRSRLWTMRLFAGFGTAEDTNVRFRELLRSGSGGLSVAFDLPTLMGRDSDDPHSEGEVGRCGVAVDTLADAEDLFAGIDLSAVTTSMTINSPAAILFAMYVAAAESSGASRKSLGGTIQNDILKEYQAQKEYVFPPRPSMRLVVDVIRFCTAEMPLFHPVSVSGYHIREAGSTAVQELAFTLANGFAYVEAARLAGLDVDDFAPRLSFFFNAHIDFFEEIAKYRAARRIWARWMTDRYGVRSARSAQLKFHTQTAGVSLTAQQPEVNIVRTAVEALAGVLGGTQSLHTNSMDEVLALPTERAARIALRTQQVLAHETGVANVADPLGGSWFVEALTDEVEREAEAIFATIEELGGGSMLEGALRGIEENWFQSEIADSAYRFQRRVASRRRIIVGVNGFTEGNEEPAPPTLHIGPEVEEAQRKRLDLVRHRRSQQVVDTALRSVAADASDPEVNLVPSILEAVRAYATEGEIIDALASVFGRWAEDPVV